MVPTIFVFIPSYPQGIEWLIFHIITSDKKADTSDVDFYMASTCRGGFSKLHFSSLFFSLVPQPPAPNPRAIFYFPLNTVEIVIVFFLPELDSKENTSLSKLNSSMYQGSLS